MAKITLDQVKQKIEEGHEKAHKDSEALRDEVKIVGDYLKKYFDGLARNRLDDLEAAREKKAAKSSSLIQSIKDNSPTPSDFTKLFGLPTLAALIGALEGLRGWELRAVKNLGKILKGIKNFAKRIGDLVKRLGRGIRNVGRALGKGLRGLNKIAKVVTDPIIKGIKNIGKALRTSLRNIAKPIVDPIKNSFRNIGKSLNTGLKNITRSITDPIKMGIRSLGKKFSVTLKDIASSKIIKSITDPIRNGLQSLRNTARALVLSTALRGSGKGTRRVKNLIPELAPEKLTKGFQQLGKAFSSIGKSFSSVIKAVSPIVNGISNLAKGAGSAVASVGTGGLKLLGAGLGPVVKLFGKILWPLGVLMSLFEGVKAYQAKEGDQADKFAAGIAGFIGDFVGAPMNLIKGALSWVLKEMGFEKAGEWLDKNINFSETISNTLNTLWDWFRGGLRWFGTLLTDPVEALKQLWNGLLEGSANLGEWLWNKGIKPIGEWVLSFIPNPVPWLKEQWNSIWGGVKDFGSWLWSNTFGALGEWVKSFLPNPVESLKASWSALWGDVTGFGDYIWVNAIEPIGNWFKTLFTNPIEALKQYWSTLLSGAETIGGFILENLVRPLGNWISGLFNITWPSVNFSAVISDLKDSILSYASGIIDYLKNAIKNWWNGAKDNYVPESPDNNMNKYISEWGDTDYSTPSPRLNGEISYWDPETGERFTGKKAAEITARNRRFEERKAALGLENNYRIQASDISEIESFLKRNSNTGPAAVISAPSTVTTKTDNSINVQNTYNGGANNIDPNAFALPGYYRR